MYAILTVLHNIADNTKLIEVTTSALGTEWLLESDLNELAQVAAEKEAQM